MAFKGKKTRKISDPTSENIAIVTPISVKNLTLTNGNSTVHFKRLGYHNCPNLKAGNGTNSAEFRGNEVLVDMGRWPFVIEMYQTIVNLDRTPRTKLNIFNGLVVLIQVCDQNSVEDILSKNAVELFVDELKNRYMKGGKGKSLQGIQNAVKVITKEINLFNDLEAKNVFFQFPNDTTPVTPYTDLEVKQIVKNLYKIYSAYGKHLLEGSTPENFPLYDEDKLLKSAPSIGFLRSRWRKKISTKNNIDTWKMDLVRSAYYLMCFFTGINHGQLSELKVLDITGGDFIESSRGKYILITTKNRQKGRQNLDEIGFTKRAKDFVESWVYMARILDSSETAILFPRVVNGKCYRQDGVSIYGGLNHSFQALGLPRLSNQKFRKTKASIIFRATDSIFSTAEGLNNNPETVARHYSDGNPVQSKMALAAVLDIRERTAQGESVSDAKENSVFSYRDPIRKSAYPKTTANIPTLSPSGIRCTAPFGEKAKALKNSLIDAKLASDHESVACHKFLECFGCDNHAIIAEIEDVWLMLSFRDVLLGVMSRPSINSMPGDILIKVAATVESILSRLQDEFIDVYSSAMKRYMDAPHPLWSSEDDFDLLREVW
ncbi:hypothetical protein SAMN02745866_00511 [Alteromonadaceae bacterium Bs31]|nr:hypothetical protein SAMN02745866_00511 [Alteromonadaceae bacterium Bs31]